MTSIIARPRLSPKIRLRYDRHAGRYLLLYPEMGLVLSQTAEEIARLCTGEWTLNDITQYLAHIHPEASPCEIAQDVCDFLKTLTDRGLLQGFK
jgi:pyrroloquinoline quinone biosynthesis protein D